MVLTLIFCILGNVSCFLSSADQLFRKILSGIPSECQTVWICKVTQKTKSSHILLDYLQSVFVSLEQSCFRKIHREYYMSAHVY